MIYQKTLQILKMFAYIVVFMMVALVFSQGEFQSSIMLLYPDGSVQEYNLNSRETGARLDLNLVSVQISRTYNRMYGLQRPQALVGFITTGESRIIEFNMVSAIIDTIYERDNIIGFVLSPDDEHMIVSYLPEEIEGPLRYLPTFLCVLHLSDPVCREIELPEARYSVAWAGTDHFLVYGSERNWFTVDFETLIPEPFPVQVQIMNTVDMGDEIFVSRLHPTHSDEVFGYINTITGEFRAYNFIPELEFPLAIANMKPSPDRQHLLFIDRESYYVLEMASGSIIAELDGLHNPEWLSNNQIIAQYFPIPGHLPHEIVIYHLEMGAIETLASFDETTFVIVIPH